MQQISAMDYIPWCGDDQELAGPSDHIPNPPILTGMTYNVRPIHCSSPSDFVVRNCDREGEYAQLKKELSDICQEKPRWLRIRIEDARTMTPIAYVDSDHHAGRGYVIVNETSPELVIFDVDEGIYQEVHIENVFYLGKDHASIPAFAIQCAVQGVKPSSFNIWSQETCEAFAEFLNTVCFNFEVANMRGETFFGDGVSRRDGLSLVCWLVLMGRAVQRKGNPIAYAHVEGE